MKTKTLGELFTPPELSQIKTLLQTNNQVGLREYLNVTERKTRLENNGIISDYLYYVLLTNKKHILK